MQLYMLRAEREKKPTTSMAIIAFKPLKIDGNERVFDIKHTHIHLEILVKLVNLLRIHILIEWKCEM